MAFTVKLIRLPRILIRFLIFVYQTNQLALMGVVFILQKYNSTSVAANFCHLFASHVMYCIIYLKKKTHVLKTCNEILA